MPKKTGIRGILWLAIMAAFILSGFVGYCFGQGDSPGIQVSDTAFDSTTVEVCFSPGGNCREMIIDYIESATNNIDIAIYSITNLELARALVQAYSRDVKIRVVADDRNIDSKYGKSVYLADSGIPVRYDDSRGYMHHKFAIIDGKTVITGSYNWSNSAETRNNENVIVVKNGNIARVYSDEFERLWKEFR
ncbi:phospholipase D family protein [bacterium]|nr:MAG: phospholipase D family protein [bacterium]